MLDTASRLRKIADLNRARAEILDRLASLVTTSPGLQGGEQIRVSSQLAKRHLQMMTGLASIEGEIKTLDPMQLISMLYMDTEGEPQQLEKPYNKPLRFLVWTILRDRPLAMNELVEEIRKAGYYSKSPTKDRFIGCVQQAISDCRNANLIERDPLTQVYSSTSISDSVAWERLGCKSKSRPKLAQMV